MQRVDYRRADTDEDREAIYRLRYEAYLREGAIEPNFARRLTDRYDDLDNAWIIGLHVDGRLVSSFRFHVATQEFPDMPAMQVFGDVLTPALESGHTVVDPTRFVIDPQLASETPELHLSDGAGRAHGGGVLPCRHGAGHGARRASGILSPGLRPHADLRAAALSRADQADQPDDADNPDEVRERINRRYPFFVSSLAEQAALFGYPEAFERQIGRVRPRGRERPDGTRRLAFARLRSASKRRRPGIASGGALSSTGVRFRPTHYSPAVSRPGVRAIDACRAAPPPKRGIPSWTTQDSARPASPSRVSASA